MASHKQQFFQTIAFGLFFFCLSSGAGWSSPLTSGLLPGEFVKEIGVFSYGADWKVPGEGSSRVKQSGLFLQLGYPVSTQWQGDVRFGLASFEGDNGLGFADEVSKATGTEVSHFAGLGIKGLLPLGTTWSLAPQAALDYFGGSSFTRQGTMSAIIYPPAVDEVPVQEDVTVERHIEANSALLLMWKRPKIAIYGGPELYWRQADLDSNLTIAGDSYSRNKKTVREEGFLGAIGGLTIEIGETTNLVLEVQQRSCLSFTASITYLQFDL